LTIAIGVICAGMTLTVGVGDGWSDALLLAPWTALLALACWATFWRPHVAVSDAGVQLVNVTRTIDIPWPALQAIDTRWALTLVTAFGRFTAWSAPAPGARAAMKHVLAPPGPGLGRPDDRRLRTPRSTREQIMRPGDLPDTPSGTAAAVVRGRWDQLRTAGHLDEPRLEHERAAVTWHVGTALLGLALVAVGVGVSL